MQWPKSPMKMIRIILYDHHQSWSSYPQWIMIPPWEYIWKERLTVIEIILITKFCLIKCMIIKCLMIKWMMIKSMITRINYDLTLSRGLEKAIHNQQDHLYHDNSLDDDQVFDHNDQQDHQNQWWSQWDDLTLRRHLEKATHNQRGRRMLLRPEQTWSWCSRWCSRWCCWWRCWWRCWRWWQWRCLW